jgi:hypothetical protein
MFSHALHTRSTYRFVRHYAEMVAVMFAGMFLLMAPTGWLWAGLAKGGLMVPEHAGMLACMLVAMLLRRDEYSRPAHHQAHARPVAAS